MIRSINVFCNNKQNEIADYLLPNNTDPDKMRLIIKRPKTIILLIFLLIVGVIFIVQYSSDLSLSGFSAITKTSIPLIIVITPTYKRVTRFADLIRTANTFRSIKHLHWIVIEDDVVINPFVDRLLQRTELPYNYLAYKTKDGYPKKGWYQRSMALNYLRSNIKTILGNHESGVVYFADDDNSYDIRLFNDYIRNVKKVGMWAVGLVGGSLVEAPKVENGVVVAFDVSWAPKRKFAVDMAGFAVNLNVILNSNAVFPKTCKRGQGAPETCLLEDLNLERSDIEPFGLDDSKEREILVWHTKTFPPKLHLKNKKVDPKAINKYGFVIENNNNRL